MICYIVCSPDYKEAALTGEHLIFGINILGGLSMSYIYQKVYKYKRYPHFDNKVHWRTVKGNVETPEYIIHHAFFPFIHYEQKMTKFPKKFIEKKPEGSKRDDPKTRQIMYSSHIDRYIYEYYSFLINKKYNIFANNFGINNCAVAYRTNHHGKNNIHYAKDAFDFIRKKQHALIVIGDFTKYFDCIDHRYLKNQLCKVLAVDSLPEDYYAVFRSITKHSWFELDEIRKYKGLERKEFNKLERIFTPEEFRAFKKGRIHTNTNGYGIPQGSAISATFSNIYLIDFDKQINDYVTSRGGFYRRYCDDFIIVIPWMEDQSNKESLHFIFQAIKCIPRLDLQPDKTQVYEYDTKKIINYNKEYLNSDKNQKSIISYLGFTFDGSTVTIRSKTIAKYYERMYKKIDNINKNNRTSPNGKKIPLRNLYRLYSYKGKAVEKNNKKRGNFLSYVDRAKIVFGSTEAIERGTKHAWGKMQKRLKRKK